MCRAWRPAAQRISSAFPARRRRRHRPPSCTVSRLRCTTSVGHGLALPHAALGALMTSTHSLLQLQGRPLDPPPAIPRHRSLVPVRRCRLEILRSRFDSLRILLRRGRPCFCKSFASSATASLHEPRDSMSMPRDSQRIESPARLPCSAPNSILARRKPLRRLGFFPSWMKRTPSEPHRSCGRTAVIQPSRKVASLAQSWSSSPARKPRANEISRRQRIRRHRNRPIPARRSAFAVQACGSPSMAWARTPTKQDSLRHSSAPVLLPQNSSNALGRVGLSSPRPSFSPRFRSRRHGIERT